MTDRNGLVTDDRAQRAAARRPRSSRPAASARRWRSARGGWLSSITDPGGNATQLGLDAGGLLTSLTTPRNEEHTYTYDALGLLTRDDDPAGGQTTLARTDLADGWEVTRTTALGRVTTYRYEHKTDGSIARRVTDPFGGVTTWTTDAAGAQRLERPDGAVEQWTDGRRPALRPGRPAVDQRERRRARHGPTWQATRTLTSAGNPIAPDALTITETVNGEDVGVGLRRPDAHADGHEPRGQNAVADLGRQRRASPA